MRAFPVTEDFPPECSLHIFSYLGLKDTLTFGEASMSCLKEVLPDLNHRRKRMKQRYAYWRDWKATKGPEARTMIVWNGDVGEEYHEHDHVPSVTSRWVALPTVQERAEQLCHRIPESHPLHELVDELRKELLRDVDSSQLVSSPLCFALLLTLHRLVVRPLKLYSLILCRVVYSDPLSKSCEGGTPIISNSSTVTASLDQYMGDVMALTYLIQFSDLGIVEGGPTNASCARQIHRSMTLEPVSCYRAWVYMHSSILRVKKFTKAQRKRLGIPEGLCKVSEMIPHDCYVDERFMSSEMILAFYEFGRLGPAFRGRDVVEVREMPARSLFAFFVTDNVHFQGETTRSALEWLCLLHEQTRKVRPMTVSPPVIRFCRPQPHVHLA